jgi:hypothetical protein
MYLETSQVGNIPEGLELADWSQAEFKSIPKFARLALARKSERIWTLKSGEEVVLVCGVLVPALVSQPELWLLLCEGFKKTLRRNLTETRELVGSLIDLYPNVMIRVDARYPVGHKFASFMNFTQIASLPSPDGREYGIYKVIR